MTPSVSMARAPQEQYKLLDVPPFFAIASNAHARNAYGNVAQEIACAALGLQAIPIDGRCGTCFDAEDSQGGFYEIKSVHRNGKLVIYDWRMEKEFGHGLRYAVVVHNARGCRTSGSLLFAYRQFLEIWILPAPVIHSAARKCPLRTLAKPSQDPRNGYSRKGYVRGYRNLGLGGIKPTATRELNFTLYGQPWRALLRVN